MNILLIEDEDLLRDLYKREFEVAGFTINAFPLGREGLASIPQNHYDLVLLDIMLPDLNGLEILKELKQNPAMKNVPVLLLTNLGQDVTIKKGFELGAEGYLVKASYTPSQVIQEVKNILQKRASGQTTPPQAPQIVGQTTVSTQSVPPQAQPTPQTQAPQPPGNPTERKI